MKKLILLLLSLLAASTAQAAEYKFHYPSGQTFTEDTSGGKVESLTTSFDTTTEVLSVSLTYSAVNGSIPDGFSLIVTNGPTPQSSPGQYAIFYFDGTGATPIITTYVANGVGLSDSSWFDGSSADSVQPPVKVASSLKSGDFTGSVTNNADGTRTFFFAVDATAINDFAGGSNYQGAGFADRIGFQVTSAVGQQTAYGDDGFLTEYAHGTCGSGRASCGLFFTEACTSGNCGTETNTSPICSGIAGTATVRVGESYTKTFADAGSDADGDQLVVSYTGAPSGATITPASGSTNASPVSIAFAWTPQAADEGTTKTIRVTFTDVTTHQAPSGTASCEFAVTVPDETITINNDCAGTPNGTATVDRCGVCGGDGTSCLACVNTDITDLLVTLDSNAGAQQQVVRRAVSRLKKLRNDAATARFAKQSLATAKALYLESWNFVWTSPRVNTQCGNATFCVSRDNSAPINGFIANSAAFKALTDQTLKRLKKARGGVASKADKALAKANARLHEENIGFSAQVPRTASFCS